MQSYSTIYNHLLKLKTWLIMPFDGPYFYDTSKLDVFFILSSVFLG